MRARLGGCTAVLLTSAVLLAGCADDADSSDSAEEPSPGPQTSRGATDGFKPRPGPVRFEFDAGRHADKPAVRAYVGWQRAATKSIRDRALSAAVRDGAARSPVDTVRQSIETATESDYVVPRRMVGRLASMQATPRAAILDACLWSPSFDYRERESGRTVATDEPHWMGVEVRMSRTSGHHGAWKVSGLSVQQDCKGSRP